MKKILTIFGYTISLTTALGVFLHDGAIDRAATTSINNAISRGLVHGTPTVTDSGVSADLHTHPEHASHKKLKNTSNRNPLIHPRERKEKKFMLQKYASRGHHAFDNYNLPIVA